MKKRNEQLLDALSDVGMDLVEETEVHSSFGMNWRRFGSLAACLVLVAGITAAGVKFLPKLVSTTPDPNPTLSGDPVPEPSPAPDPNVHIPTPPVSGPDDGPGIPEDPADVRFLYSEQGTYTDSVDNYSAYFWQVPQLNFSTPDAIAINKAIADRFGPLVEEEKKNMEEGLSLNAGDIKCTIFYNYDPATEDEIITLLCYQETLNDLTYYVSYHYHTGRGEELSNGELLELMGFDTDEYLTALKQAAASRYLHNVMVQSNFRPQRQISYTKPITEYDFRWQQYCRTISDENITLDVPLYVTHGNEGPIVVAMPNIYAVAGANYYPEEVNVLGEKPGWIGKWGDNVLNHKELLGNAWPNTMTMTLYWADPENPDTCGAYETVDLPRDWYYERLCVLTSGYQWTEFEGLPPEPGNFWLNLSGGSLNWTFWDDGDAGFLMIYDESGKSQCWKADFLYTADENSGFSIADAIRFEYDGAAVDYNRFTAEADGTSDEIAAQIAEAYGRWLCAQAPGSNYGATEYAVVSTEVRTVCDTKWQTWFNSYGIQFADLDESDTGTDVYTILFDFRLALKPELDGMRSALWAGNGYEGTGQWEGWMIFSRECIVQLWPDGQWHITNLGTGGVMLPEE